MEINTINKRIIPDKPKVLNKEQIEIYVPTANYNYPGLASFDPVGFIIGPDGKVRLRKSSVRSVSTFTMDPVTGEGVIYYDDGTTSKLRFPITTDNLYQRNNLMTIVEVTGASFIQDETTGLWVAGFSKAITGFTDDKFIVSFEEYGSYDYSTEIDGHMTRYGYYTIQDTVFKGKDGSILLAFENEEDVKSFTGRLLLLGGEIFTDNQILSITYNPSSNKIQIFKTDGTIETINAVTEEYITEQLPNIVSDLVDKRLSKVYSFRGTTLFENLPSYNELQTGKYEGYVWYVKNYFLGDNRFIDGNGKPFDAGTNVTVIKSDDGKYYFDILGGIYDLSNYYTKDEIDVEIAKKQDNIYFDGDYNATTNKAATVKTVTDKIAEIIAGADTSYDTLKEIADWIKAHPESVAEINAKIAQNAENIAKKQDKLKAGPNITIAEDGTISASGSGSGGGGTVPEGFNPDDYVKKDADNVMSGSLEVEDANGYSKVTAGDVSVSYAGDAYDASLRYNGINISGYGNGERYSGNLKFPYITQDETIATESYVQGYVQEYALNKNGGQFKGVLYTGEQIQSGNRSIEIGIDDPTDGGFVGIYFDTNYTTLEFDKIYRYVELTDKQMHLYFPTDKEGDQTFAMLSDTVGGAAASVDENNELTIEIKDKAGNVVATTKVALPSGGEGGIDETAVRTIAEEKASGALTEAKKYTDEELAKFDFIKIVSELPVEGLPNKIYLVPQGNGESPDFFVEYLWVNKGTESEPVWVWEYVGTKTVEIDLTNYYTKDEVNSGFVSTMEKTSWRRNTTIAYVANVNSDGEAVNTVMPVGARIDDGLARYSLKRLETDTPVKDVHCANKQYVDDLIAQLKADNSLV